ncbi:alpha/beta fold hydrolase [Cellulosimicrobium sp. PMB13]|uniref:alpha/beta fold hydrolase n=1 Tax=Cellulosimicrobium sp. PMB13 TaxID=3120158 RepID=UPI003F4C8332
MPTKTGDFLDDAAREAYERADRALEARWPLPSTVLDVPTPYGPTSVRRSGTGDRTPLVLLHGLNGNGLSWHAVVSELAADRVVLAPDVVGTAGRSRQTAPLTGPADYAAWGEALLDGLRLERAHLLGYSEGAWLAALVAARVPHRLASLTLGEGITALTRPSAGALARILAAGALPTDRRLARLEAWLSPGAASTAEDRAVARAAMRFRRRTPWPSPLTDAELRAITTPTLALFGAQSRLGDPVAAGRRVTENVPDAVVDLVPGGGHGLLWQLPEVVLPRVTAFLRAHDA